MKLSEIRAKFPQYDDLPDEQLVIGLRKKYYADIPMAEFSKAIEYDNAPDPTEGMSAFDRGAAGAGKAIVDTVRGAGQWLGLADRADVAESRKRDAALMNTTAGKIGNFAGNAALMAPAAFIPGAATIPGAAMVGAGFGLMQPSVSTGETLTNAALGGAGGAAGQLIANKAPALLRGVVDKAKSLQTANAQKFAAAQAGAKQGYVVPPADLEPGVVSELASGLSGKIKTAQVASQRNQGVTDELARKAIGLKAGDELNSDVLQNIRRQASTAYNAVKGSGQVQADAAFDSALNAIAATQQGAGRSFPGLQNNGVTDLIASLNQKAFDAGDAVDATKVLREMADKAYRQGDTTLGKAAKGASDALEGMLERHLQATGQPDALKAFQEARKLIAKTYSVQKSLNTETGNVAAGKLASELQKGRPLSGELRDIAEMGTAFPKAMQSLKEAPKAVSPLDFAVAATTGASTGNPLALTMLGARPLARNALLSGFVQRQAMQQGAPAPISQATQALLENRLAQLMAMPAGATSAIQAGR